jgi:hypothetical protein
VQGADDVSNFLAEDVDLGNELFHVVNAGDEDLVFDGLGFGLDGSGVGLEAVDNVVTGILLFILSL